MSAHTPGPWRVVKGQYANEGRLFIMGQYNDGYKRDVCEVTSVMPEHFDNDAGQS